MYSDTAVIVVGYRFNGGVEEYMIRGKPFHNSINVAFCTMLEGQPLWSGSCSTQEMMIPPGFTQQCLLSQSCSKTYIKRTRVTAGNCNEHLSGLVLQTAAVI